jgi:hypothetical protein
VPRSSPKGIEYVRSTAPHSHSIRRKPSNDARGTNDPWALLDTSVEGFSGGPLMTVSIGIAERKA